MAKQPQGPQGPRAVSQADRDGERKLKRSRRDDPQPELPRGPDEVGPGQKTEKNPRGWEPDMWGLPRHAGCECPVQCLGVEGGVMHLIDSNGQYKPAESFTHEEIQKLFSAVPNYPMWMHPRRGRAVTVTKADGREVKLEGPIESFKDDLVRGSLFLACSRRGLFSAKDKLRGRGAWRLHGGQLVYHAGDQVWTLDGANIVPMPPGVIDGHLYPRLPEIPSPFAEPFPAADNPARYLLEGLRNWNWRRPLVDPVLMLGWIGVAFLGGALDWRSAIFLVGDAGTGKSELQRALKALFGEALFHSVDTTAAGIHQDMGHESRPIALDEIEATADPRKVTSVIELARSASSGGFLRRGSASHQATSFQMHSAFLFSAINAPALLPQDLSRMAMLRLNPLPAGVGEPPLRETDAEFGRLLLAQLMRQWPRFEKVLPVYRKMLGEAGHDARGQDTYGTLLACADLMLDAETAAELDVPLTENLEFWREQLNADLLPETEDREANWRACLGHLLDAQVEPWRNGARATVAAALRDLEQFEESGGAHAGEGEGYHRAKAKRDLELTGLGLIAPGEMSTLGLTPDLGFLLVVPNQHPLVAKLFAGTRWAGVPGAGVWTGALRDAPDGIALFDRSYNRVRVAGRQKRSTLIVLKRFHARED